MTDAAERAAATIADVLEQVVTLHAETITFEPRGAAGSMARVLVAGGLHEILCELNADGELLSARVIER